MQALKYPKGDIELLLVVPELDGYKIKVDDPCGTLKAAEYD